MQQECFSELVSASQGLVNSVNDVVDRLIELSAASEIDRDDIAEQATSLKNLIFSYQSNLIALLTKPKLEVANILGDFTQTQSN